MEHPSTNIKFIEANVGVDQPNSIQNDMQYHKEVLSRLGILRTYARKLLQELGCFSEGQVFKADLCLEEVLVNAVLHGNLERGSKDVEEVSEDDTTHPALYGRSVAVEMGFGVAEEMQQPTLQQHTEKLVDTNEETNQEKIIEECRLKIAGQLPDVFTINTFTIRVTDEGQGFNPDDLPDPTAEENLGRPCGRGVMLMRSFAQKLEYNEKGNSVYLEIAADVSQE